MIGKVVHQLRNGWHFLHKIFIVYNSASKTSKKDRQQPIRKTHVLHGGSTRKCARTMKNSLNRREDRVEDDGYSVIQKALLVRTTISLFTRHTSL